MIQFLELESFNSKKNMVLNAMKIFQSVIISTGLIHAALILT